MPDPHEADPRPGPDVPPPRVTGPPMSPEQQRIESAIDQAIARGDFDDLPGAGKPLDLPARHDPDWWIKQRLREEDLDTDALLPVVMLLRREAQDVPGTVAAMTEESEVRAYVADFNARVRDDRLRSPLARTYAPTLEVEEVVARWRRERPEGPHARTPDEPQRRPRRRWWQRRRS